MTERSTKTINRVGNSLSINITSEARALGLDRGDKVDVTLEPHAEDKIVIEIISYPTIDTDFQTIKATLNGEVLTQMLVTSGQYVIKGQVFRFLTRVPYRQDIRYDELVIRDATPEEVKLMAEEEPII